jgi:hypothetical protein
VYPKTKPTPTAQKKHPSEDGANYNGEEMRQGKEYCHWAGVILHLTSSGE